MKKTGMVLLGIGVLVTIATSLDFVTKRKVVDMGTIEISADEKHGLTWSPLVGLAVMVAG